MQFVVNEWLPEYFQKDASKEQKFMLQKFLQRFYERNDILIVLDGSPFLQKIYSYLKDRQPTDQTYITLKNFYGMILLDSERCRRVMPEEVNLEEEIRIQLLSEGNYVSDMYLFEAASITNEKIIITTDEKLQRFMRQQNIYNVILLSELLKEY